MDGGGDGAVLDDVVAVLGGEVLQFGRERSTLLGEVAESGSEVTAVGVGELVGSLGSWVGWPGRWGRVRSELAIPEPESAARLEELLR